MTIIITATLLVLLCVCGCSGRNSSATRPEVIPTIGSLEGRVAFEGMRGTRITWIIGDETGHVLTGLPVEIEFKVNPGEKIHFETEKGTRCYLWIDGKIVNSGVTSCGKQNW